MESCLHSGLEREDDGVQLVPHRGEEHPVFPADEESSAPSWPDCTRRGVHGDERGVFRFSSLHKEVQAETGKITVLEEHPCLSVSHRYPYTVIENPSKIHIYSSRSADLTNFGRPPQYFPAFSHGGQNAFHPSMAVPAGVCHQVLHCQVILLTHL